MYIIFYAKQYMNTLLLLLLKSYFLQHLYCPKHISDYLLKHCSTYVYKKYHMIILQWLLKLKITKSTQSHGIYIQMVTAYHWCWLLRSQVDKDCWTVVLYWTYTSTQGKFSTFKKLNLMLLKLILHECIVFTIMFIPMHGSSDSLSFAPLFLFSSFLLG